MTLILQGTDNSVSSPAVQGGTAGTTTGVYYPATNQIALATNGALALIADASQNVGVNVTPSSAPSGTLFVRRNISSTTTAPFSLYSNATLNTAETNDLYISTGFASRYYQQNGNHVLQSASSGTAGGTITFTNVLSVNKDTTLVLQGGSSSSGAGIAFPSTQSASSNANTLDDYEEGTWTPTDASGAGVSLTVAYARYTKIGRVVSVEMDLVYGTTSNVVNSQITMPFTPQDYASGIAGWSNNNVSIKGHISSTGYYFMNCQGASGNTHLSNANMSGIRVIASGWFYVT